MVWGMKQPESFGKFWPYGDIEFGYEGPETQTGAGSWWNRLMNHYLAQSREEQKRLFNFGDEAGSLGSAHSYAAFAKAKFWNEIGTTDSPNERPPFTPIEPHEVPQSFTTKPYPALGDKKIDDDEATLNFFENYRKKRFKS